MILGRGRLAKSSINQPTSDGKGGWMDYQSMVDQAKIDSQL